MKVVTIAASKGGAGKTTVTCILAVRAVMESMRVALFDLNADQANLTQWWVLRGRGELMNPKLYEVDKISTDVEVLRNEKFDWLFIDTPPLDLDVTEAAIIKSDAVIIPVRSSIFDFGAVTPIVEICKERRKPFSFLMSAVDNRFTKLNQRTMAALVADGPLLSARISYRQDYISALTVGKVGFEIQRDLKDEVDQLWAEVKRLASHGPISRRVANE
jgi:chromosome partitioning protein